MGFAKGALIGSLVTITAGSLFYYKVQNDNSQVKGYLKSAVKVEKDYTPVLVDVWNTRAVRENWNNALTAIASKLGRF